MGFSVPISFAWPANDASLPQTNRKRRYQPVLWFHSAQEEALLLDVLSRSIKKRLFSSVTPRRGSLEFATGWHGDRVAHCLQCTSMEIDTKLTVKTIYDISPFFIRF